MRSATFAARLGVEGMVILGRSISPRAMKVVGEEPHRRWIEVVCEI
jgi:hypothetical protein